MSDKEKEICIIKTTENKSKTSVIYLNTEIKESEYYIDLYEVLREAGENDTVEIHINNRGGILDTAIQIVNMINGCKGKVITVLNGIGASAGSIIFMAGDEKRVEPHSTLMCHFYSGCAYGKGGEMEQYVKYNQQNVKAFCKDIYKDLMTKEELEQMFDGKDFWFSHTEVINRLKLK